MLSLFVAAFLLGLVYNAMPGAVFAETVRQGVRGGFAPALAVQLGSLSGDALWAVLGLAGIGLLLQLEWLRLPVGIAGVGYLLFLAWDSWRAADRDFLVAIDAVQCQKQALQAGMLISLTNPHNLAYWAAVGSALGALGVQNPAAADYMIFFAGFMLCSLLWCFFCAAFVDRVFRVAGQRWANVTYKLCALAFVLLAVGSLWDLLPKDNSSIDGAQLSPVSVRNT
ncbi:MAG: LysE family transporter [Gammaproteobacteria bacterium]|nr:LysE family transporter [Gammaproteobacteria bacterium]